jgi:hypothetical protein
VVGLVAKRWSSLALIGLFGCKPGEAKPVIASSASAAPAASVPATGASAPPGAPATGSPKGGASDPRSDGQPGCRFERLAVWTAGRVSWLGGCHEGFAHGSGVIVNEVEGLEPDRFYGRVEDGHPSVGVLQSNGGYRAGTWVRGALAEPLADDVAQRNVVIGAFQAAATAATAVSELFAKKADAKSSRFYATQTRLLRDQMD